jgi:hypothetical protein
MVLIKLASPAESVLPAKTNSVSSLSSVQSGRIVGFGHTSFLANDHGIKRFATVETSACSPPDDSSICWQYDDDDELGSTCHVDSGGPLFVVGSDGNAVLAGVTSTTDAQCSDDTQSFDVNVQYFSDWISDNGGSDVGLASCGAGPVGGNPFTANGTLGPDESHEFVFDVPAGAGSVVVALNGQEDSSMNFDLETVLVSSDFVVLDTCTKDGEANFASCRLAMAQPGARILGAIIQRGTENGEFQLMVSAY